MTTIRFAIAGLVKQRPGNDEDLARKLPGENAALELNRYVPGVQGKEELHEPRARLLRHIANINVPDAGGYVDAFSRWQKLCGELQPAAGTHRFRVQGHMIVGLGAENVLGSSIALNHPWGVPYIPGAVLKGLASHYVEGVMAGGDPAFMRAPAAIRPDSRTYSPPNVHGVLFGTTGETAYIIWHDAWLIPDTPENRKPFRRDVVTPHHSRYYGGRATGGKSTDFDDPNPGVPFVSAGGEFLVCLQGPDDTWVNLAFDVLREALANTGIGAKTHTGYGRLALVE